MGKLNLPVLDSLSKIHDFSSCAVESYYLGPLEQIDNLLIEAEQAILSLISWNEKFKVSIRLKLGTGCYNTLSFLQTNLLIFICSIGVIFGLCKIVIKG